jgi:citrate synthase
MNKSAVVGVASVAALAVILLTKKAKTSESLQEREARRAEKRREMFEKMRAHMESMPEDFPPLVMFTNVAAIRENTDRILELLETDRSDTEEPDAPTSA